MAPYGGYEARRIPRRYARFGQPRCRLHPFKKFAWYGSSVAFAALLAVSLLVAQAPSVAHAAHGDVTLPDGSSVGVGSKVKIAVETNATNEVQTVTISAAATGGEYRLTFDSQQTGDLAHNANAAAIQAALIALSNVPTGGVTVADVGGVDDGLAETTGFTVTFNFGGNVAALTAQDGTNALTNAGGGVGDVAVAETTAGVAPTTVADLSISGSSTGQGKFVQGGGQTLTRIDDQTGDTDPLHGSIAVELEGVATGSVIVNVVAGGQSSSVGINVTAVTAVAAIVLGTPTVAQLTATDTGTPSGISVRLNDAQGNELTGRSFTVSTNLGVLSTTGATATTCSFTGSGALTTANGKASCTTTNNPAAANNFVSLFPTGTAGTATVTVTAGDLTATRTVVFAGGTPTSLSVDVVGGTNTANTALLGANTVIHDRDITGGTDNNRDEALVVVRALDANGNSIIPSQDDVTIRVKNAAGDVVSGFLATAVEDMTAAGVGTIGGGGIASGVCTDAIQAGGGTIGSVGVCTIDVEAASTSALARGTYTVEAQWVSGTTTLTATQEITVAGPAATVTVNPGTPEIGTNSTITAAAFDSDGNPVADGTTITMNVSNANALVSNAAGTVGSSVTATTTGGTATWTLIPVSTGTSVAVAVATGGISGSQSFTVTGPDTTAPVVTAPADISVEIAADATGADATNAAIAAFLAGATATDNVDATVAVTNDAPAIFPVGATTVTFTATDAAGNVGTATAVVTVTEAAAPDTTPAPGDGSLTAPSFGTGNVGSAVFDGGTIEQLATAVTASGGTAAWVQGTDGNWYRYNTLATGATAFVNNAFNAQFAAGLSQSAVFVVK